jgi:hypothetical protein
VYCSIGLLLLLGLLFVLLVVFRRQATVPTIAESAKTPQGPDAVKVLDQRLSRLEQLRSWMGEDPELERLIDDTIGKRVRAAERRQQYLSVGFGVASLIAGWLLSAVSAPAVLFNLLPH